MAAQLSMRLEFPASLSRDELVIGAANKDAFQWLQNWPDWPGPASALNICGPTGSGKSTLAQYFAARHNLPILTSLPHFSTSEMPSPHLILDGVENNEAWSAEALFHLYNWVVEQEGSLLLMSSLPVARIDWGLADLTSRLSTAAAEMLLVPDDEFLEAFLQCLFAKKQCTVPASVLHYLISHMPRDYSYAIALVDAVDKASLDAKKPITVPMMKHVLANFSLSKAQAIKGE